MAATLAELMKRCLVPWETFKECFSASLSALPDLKIHGRTWQTTWAAANSCDHLNIQRFTVVYLLWSLTRQLEQRRELLSGGRNDESKCQPFRFAMFCHIWIAFLLRMDAPHCDIMVHCLIARLLMLENFNQVPSTTVDVWSLEHEPRNGMGQKGVPLKNH